MAQSCPFHSINTNIRFVFPYQLAGRDSESTSAMGFCLSCAAAGCSPFLLGTRALRGAFAFLAVDGGKLDLLDDISTSRLKSSRSRLFCGVFWLDAAVCAPWTSPFLLPSIVFRTDYLVTDKWLSKCLVSGSSGLFSGMLTSISYSSFKLFFEDVFVSWRFDSIPSLASSKTHYTLNQINSSFTRTSIIT